jgi:hypothetical protein
VKEKPTVDSPFFGAFPSDRIPKAMKNISIHLFIYSNNSRKLSQPIPGTVTKVVLYRDFGVIFVTIRFIAKFLRKSY